MEINMRKEKIKLGVLAVAILMLVVSVSYAFFIAFLGSNADTNFDIASEVSEALIFTPGEPLNMNASILNFSKEDSSLSESTTSTATLRASSEAGSATDEYYIYYNITSNDFEYTVDANTPELLITFNGPDGEIKNIDGLNYRTITDAKTGKEIGGFDVTTFTGFIPVKLSQSITTTNETTQSWSATLTFVNLTTTQVDNEGKIFESELILQAEEKKFPITEQVLLHNGGIDYIESRPIPNFTQVATDDQGMFATTDDYGTSYYFRGAVDNNWVYFAGMYWRIVRINGDKNVRLMYSGLEAPSESESIVMSDSVSAGNANFHSVNSRIEFGGYKYTYNEARGLNSNTVIKNTVDNWYYNNLVDYKNYLADSLFCGNRTLYGSSGVVPAVGAATSYNTFLSSSITTSPSLICYNNLDAYTVNDLISGNGALVYPIALISIEELIFAGSTLTLSNNKFYLYKNFIQWTISPYYTNVAGVAIAVLDNTGKIGAISADYPYYYNPVINLKSDVMVTGDGTWDNPYTVAQ